MNGRRLTLCLVLASSLAACSASGGTATDGAAATVTPSTAVSAGSTARALELTVYAAASLKGALETATTAYAGAVPGVTITLATDSSATLRTQIEQGAPADVFLSADESNPKRLVDAGLADGAAVAFAGNTLVVIVPSANPAGIATAADLAGDGVKIIAAGAEVPISKYAAQAVTNLSKQPGYPAGFVAAYGANVVSREDNVKAVVAKIELGEGDAAIVYATDAKASTRVGTVEIPAVANVPATYAGVVLKDSTHVDAARAFLAWLAGPGGQAVLTTFGFQPPP
jgi:molybdate transport system substrate-binding protein